MATQQSIDFQLKHPFSMMACGPSTCGKTTYFVKTLLQNNLTKVTPPVQRIVWLYKRWQPLYDVILTTVTPQVEFIQGIPLDWEQDSFFDPAVENMIVLDDVMTTASKDPCISDLFTEGSHHRNLSVIVLNQNYDLGATIISIKTSVFYTNVREGYRGTQHLLTDRFETDHGRKGQV
jgi:hypothetical protein